MAPPDNDRIADAEDLVGAQGEVLGDTTGAGLDPDEPAAVNAWELAPSVWYRWEAPTSEEYLFWSVPDFYCIFDVFTGTPTDLTPVFPQRCNFVITGHEPDGYEWFAPALTFAAEEGVTYWLRVYGGEPDATGTFPLRWQPVESGWGEWQPRPVAESALGGEFWWNYNAAWGESDRFRIDFDVDEAEKDTAGYSVQAWGNARTTNEFREDSHDAGSIQHGGPPFFWGARVGSLFTVDHQFPYNSQFAHRAFEAHVYVATFDATHWGLNLPRTPPDFDSRVEHPVTLERLEWEESPFTASELLPGGTLSVNGTTDVVVDWDPHPPGDENQYANSYDVRVKIDPTATIPRPVDPREPYDRSMADWHGTVSELLHGEKVGTVSSQGNEFTGFFDVDAPLAENLLPHKDGHQYLNIVLRPNALDDPPYYQQFVSYSINTVIHTLRPVLRGLMPRYRVYQYLLPTQMPPCRLWPRDDSRGPLGGPRRLGMTGKSRQTGFHPGAPGSYY